MLDSLTNSLFHRPRKHAPNNASTASASTQPSSKNASSTDTHASPLNRDALILFRPARPPRRPKVPTASGPVLPPPDIAQTTKNAAQPQPPIDPDVDAAFTDADIRPAGGTLAERAALHLTRLLRDMLQGKAEASSPGDVPFYVLIAAAYGTMQQSSVNGACQAKLTDTHTALAKALAEHVDAPKAKAAAALAQPFVSWDANDNAWAVNLYSGAFVDALWDIVGGRAAENGTQFDALMRQLQETARGPIADVLEASEERYYDLVDRVMGIIMDTQMRLNPA